jgi:hypothetical protein
MSADRARLRFSGRDFTEQELETIRAWLAEKTLCREHLARRVCQEFGWINAAGKLKTMSCKVALLRMHRAGLNLVVNNKRFLIPPWVRTPNLASRLLSLASRRIASDWLSRYGYSPVLLETFVELERFTGTCYRAANWIEVGTTKGRGKLEKNHQSVLPLKTILLYPLQKNFRAILVC